MSTVTSIVTGCCQYKWQQTRQSDSPYRSMEAFIGIMLTIDQNQITTNIIKENISGIKIISCLTIHYLLTIIFFNYKKGHPFNAHFFQST